MNHDMVSAWKKMQKANSTKEIKTPILVENYCLLGVVMDKKISSCFVFEKTVNMLTFDKTMGNNNLDITMSEGHYNLTKKVVEGLQMEKAYHISLELGNSWNWTVPFCDENLVMDMRGVLAHAMYATSILWSTPKEIDELLLAAMELRREQYYKIIGEESAGRDRLIDTLKEVVRVKHIQLMHQLTPSAELMNATQEQLETIDREREEMKYADRVYRWEFLLDR